MDSTKIRALPADLRMTKRQAEEARDARMTRAHQLMEAGGGVTPKLDAKAVDEFKQLNDDLDRLTKYIEDDQYLEPFLVNGEEWGHPFGGDDSSSKSVGAPAPHGWKGGHWSQPFRRHAKDLTPSGSVAVPSLTSGIMRDPERPRRLLEVIPTMVLRGTDQYSFLRQESYVNSASPVAVGAQKPTSTYAVERVDDTVQTIAHLSEAIPRQTLADAALLSGYLETVLREGVMLALEEQVVSGDGVDPNLLGFAEDPGRQQILFDTSILQTAREALTALQEVNIEEGVFCFTPGAWELLELAQDDTASYYYGGPVNRAERRLWGQRVLVSSAVSSAFGYLVDFKNSTMLWEREGVRIDWSENVYDSVSGMTDFEANLIRFRAEGRWGFGVLRPNGVVEFPLADT